MKREELQSISVSTFTLKHCELLSDEDLKAIDIEMIMEFDRQGEEDYEGPSEHTTKLFSIERVFGKGYDATSSIEELKSEIRECISKEGKLNYLKDCLIYLNNEIRKDYNPFYTIDNIYINLLSLAEEDDYELRQQKIIRAAQNEVICMIDETEGGKWIDYVDYDFEYNQYPNHLYEYVNNTLWNLKELNHDLFCNIYIEKCKQFTPLKNWLTEQIEELSSTTLEIEMDNNIYSFKVNDNNLLNLPLLFKYLKDESIIAAETTYYELLICFLALPIHYIKKPVIWLNSDVQLIRFLTDLDTMGIILTNNKFNTIIENCFESKHRGGKIKGVKQKKSQILNIKFTHFKNERETPQLSEMKSIMTKR